MTVSEPMVQLKLTNPSQIHSFSHVLFSMEGAEFGNGHIPSYLVLDSIPDISKSFNLSFWFRVRGDNGKIPQVLFKAFNRNNPKEQLALWMSGFRVTGNLNSNRFSAKEFSKELPISRDFYDLPRLEVGKYYFLSVNKIDNTIQVFINAELYGEYKIIKDTNIVINSCIFGVLNTEGSYTNQLYGFLRNFEIYEQPLSQDEIYSVSVKHFKEIQPFNDAFELSKFKIID
ncbi:LamG domain-containing protein [Aureisphaera sp. CAU 1614]|uniref:LamG domain-containing protein n=1 Tax=Halomarinibacterium sedimenti TaxID=2857106 RepID=A0A9X1JY72_9FLAO|nr:LamG domain-containing protein [Halomarinibacterium sedimenti]MBW2937247.1 LamG domain-containing protein [Halomarinibacterium sedimenti]